MAQALQLLEKMEDADPMVRELMMKRLVVAEPDAKVSEVAKLMAREDVGSVLVLDNGKPRGLITDRDIVVRCIAENIDVDDCTVENVMTESLQTVKETDGVFDCIENMKGAGVRRIPVVDARGKAVGVISFGDLLAMLTKELSELTARTTPAAECEDGLHKIKVA